MTHRAGDAFPGAAPSASASAASRDVPRTAEPSDQGRDAEAAVAEPAFEPMPGTRGERQAAPTPVSALERKTEAKESQGGISHAVPSQGASSGDDSDEPGVDTGPSVVPAKPSLRDRHESVAAARERYLARKRKTAEG